MPETLRLVPSAIYRRIELHERFGGQEQGGISTPASNPVVLLFTGSAGSQHGYNDGWADGVFCYFGEGQQGDMKWLRGNVAIRDHVTRGRDLLLFEMLSEQRSYVRFLGLFACASWEIRSAPDSAGNVRQAIVFHLSPLADTDQPEEVVPVVAASLANLRAAAIEAGRSAPLRATREAQQTYLQRSAAVRRYVLGRASGVCEACSHDAPFVTLTGAPFLEVHHIDRLSDGGPDQIHAVAALCPNCHREAHFGLQREVLKATLTAAIASKERQAQATG